MTPSVALALLWIAWVASWFAAMLWSDRAAASPGASREVGYRALAIVGIVLLFGTARLRTFTVLWNPSTTIEWTLVAVVGAGLAFTWWARLYLGRLWSSTVTRKAHHHIVDTGPYAIVRHPIYTGITVAGFATALFRAEAISLVGATLLMVSWIIKARLEEQFLREQLGAGEYDRYARRVPMLIPFFPW